MEFRLTYDGQLMARGGGADHKHEVRKVFHKQLKRLWEIHPFLQGWTRSNSAPDTTVGNVYYASEKSYLQHLGDKFKEGKYRFAPIATAERGAIVSLDILFLRSGQPGSIMKSADLDGRLKTLIDALRMPNHTQELGRHIEPDVDEDPFYCLMQDDNLVGNVSVTSDALLQPTANSTGYHDTHDARVVIAVSLRTYASNNMGAVWS